MTYCNNEEGLATESPLSKGINSWWSDCYGEAPRMFYHVLAAVPGWAPAKENHILYSEGILNKVIYSPGKIQYTAISPVDIEYVKTKFKPSKITLNGKNITQASATKKQGYILKEISDGDYQVIIRRTAAGNIIISEN